MAVSLEARNMQVVERVFTEGFNAGNLDAIDDGVSVGGVDRQHPDEPNFVEHLRNVVITLHTAFPDLHFEITRMIGDGEWVALHSVMTGTHTGPLGKPLLPPAGPPSIPATGRSIRVAHMHMIRMEEGKGVELFHLMDTLALLGQLGLR